MWWKICSCQKKKTNDEMLKCNSCDLKFRILDMWTCNTCGLDLICITCFMKNHRYHNVDEIKTTLARHEKVAEWRERMGTIIVDIHTNKVEIEGTVSNVRTTCQEILAALDEFDPSFLAVIDVMDGENMAIYEDVTTLNICEHVLSGQLDTRLEEIQKKLQVLVGRHQLLKANANSILEIVQNANQLVRNILPEMLRVDQSVSDGVDQGDGLAIGAGGEPNSNDTQVTQVNQERVSDDGNRAFMDDFKRVYTQEDTATKAIPYFWNHFDKKNFSIWHCEYKHPQELKQIFMGCNVISAMFERLARMSKIAFGSMCIFGTDGNSTISGICIWPGQEWLAFNKSKDWQADYESYEWKKLDPDNEATKKIVNEYFLWRGDFGGKTFNQGKIFKYYKSYLKRGDLREM